MRCSDMMCAIQTSSSETNDSSVFVSSFSWASSRAGCFGGLAFDLYSVLHIPTLLVLYEGHGKRTQSLFCWQWCLGRQRWHCGIVWQIWWLCVGTDTLEICQVRQKLERLHIVSIDKSSLVYSHWRQVDFYYACWDQRFEGTATAFKKEPVEQSTGGREQRNLCLWHRRIWILFLLQKLDCISTSSW